MEGWFMYKWIGLFGIGLWAALAADRPDLNGVWQLENAPGAEGKFKSETLVIHQKEDSVEISEDWTAKNGKETKDEIDCNTMGQECKLKSENVQLWYNGAMLVLMETHNNVVTKTRFSSSEDGKTLHMEVTHMAPGAPRTENLTFTKQKS
jgi:hypothetical protein